MSNGIAWEKNLRTVSISYRRTFPCVTRRWVECKRLLIVFTKYDLPVAIWAHYKVCSTSKEFVERCHFSVIFKLHPAIGASQLLNLILCGCGTISQARNLEWEMCGSTRTLSLFHWQESKARWHRSGTEFALDLVFPTSLATEESSTYQHELHPLCVTHPRHVLFSISAARH